MMFELRDLRRALGKATESLTPTEALVLCTYYLDGEPLSEAAKIIGRDKSRACQIHREALAKMRRALYPRRFDDLYPDSLSRRDDLTKVGTIHGERYDC